MVQWETHIVCDSILSSPCPMHSAHTNYCHDGDGASASTAGVSLCDMSLVQVFITSGRCGMSSANTYPHVLQSCGVCFW